MKFFKGTTSECSVHLKYKAVPILITASQNGRPGSGKTVLFAVIQNSDDGIEPTK